MGRRAGVAAVPAGVVAVAGSDLTRRTHAILRSFSVLGHIRDALDERFGAGPAREVFGDAPDWGVPSASTGRRP